MGGEFIFPTLFKIALIIWALLRFHKSIRIDFSTYAKNVIGILI